MTLGKNNMKNLLLAIILTLLCAVSAHSEAAIEANVGTSSPNKGLVGLRFSPLPWSAGIILGSFASYTDIGISGSYHFSTHEGIYVFSAHHLLLSDTGPAQTVWEIDTGVGYQYIWKIGLMVYAELGIPFFVGGGQVWRHYEAGRPYNRVPNGDMVFVSFRAGAGIGGVFYLW